MFSRQLVSKARFISFPLKPIGFALMCFFGFAVDWTAAQELELVNPPIPVQMVEPIKTVPATPIISQSQVAQPQSRPSFVAGTIVTGNAPVEAPGLPAPVLNPVESAKITQEINRIRQQLGGGLSSHFGLMSNLDPQSKRSLEESFQNEIGRLASEQAQQAELKTHQADVVGKNTIVPNTSVPNTSVPNTCLLYTSPSPRDRG